MMSDEKVVTILRRDFAAAIFDLDGVLTDTTRLHATAWKSVFDALLQQLADRQGREFRPFDINADYLAYVDGRSRYDGVRTFLTSRGIVLPEGSADDSVSAETIHALGMHKTRLFRQALQKGIDPAPGAVTLASSSENCAIILHAAGLDHLIDQRVDGRDADELGLEGKPNPGLFLEAARRLHVLPVRAIVFEDALAGVEAGHLGGFGRVVGIDRGAHPDALRRHGADIVIESLRQVQVTDN